MSNISIQNVDLGTVIYGDAKFQDELLTFGAAGTVLEGTILARDSVSGKLVPFAVGGTTNENGIPKAVVTYPVTATGAGDVKIRAMISGGVVKEKLVIAADGDASNVSSVVSDQLRVYGIVTHLVDELNILDNQ